MGTASRPIVAIQGLGFVGAAMAVAVASARRDDGEPRYTVYGVDLDNDAGRRRIDALNDSVFPFETTDTALVDALSTAMTQGNLSAGSDPAVYEQADVVVVDVPLDIDWQSTSPTLQLGGFTAAIRTIGSRIRPDTLVLLETTVPPGTTEKIVIPTLAEEFTARGLDPASLTVAHSYERVMPGADYYNSIVNYWRVYAGHTERAADAAESFLSSVINTDEYPLTRLSNTTASETAKVMENTFRATTIALMEEWARFAEMAGVDMFEIVDAIRMRPTHANLRSPGFGVGGYCITKDPLFAKLASGELFGNKMEFPFSTNAVNTNKDAPLVVCDRLEQLLGRPLDGAKVLLAGISYRQDVADTRYSPSETFVIGARERGATVEAYDPLVEYWEELDWSTPTSLPDPAGFDAVVFAVPHREFREIDMQEWLGDSTPIVYDGFSVLTREQLGAAAAAGCVVASTGRGTPATPTTSATT